MTKKLLFLVAVSGLIFANNGCTSKKAEEEQQVVENADIEKIEADGLGMPAQETADVSLESALGDIPTQEIVLEETPTQESALETPTPSDLGATTAPTIEDSSLSLDTAETPAPTTTDTPPPTDSVAPTLTETPILPSDTSSVDTAALAASLGSPTADAPPTDSTVTASKPTRSAIKKVSATMPYQGKDGAWINTVYIARPKEKLADISMKIFGADKTKELKKITENSYLKYRSVKAGDKIYYTSPNRPDDSTKTMLYYEDMGMVPEIYIAKKGENLKKISKELLGYNNAWKEVWASNAMESKTSLNDGETIRYWKIADGAVASAPPSGTATLMDASQAPPPTAQIEPPAELLPPPPADANANLPPPPTDQVPADQAPADLAAAGMAGAADSNAGLPPPPPADLSPPPPPPPPDAAAIDEPKKKVNLDEAAAAEGTGELDSDTMMSMGALGVLVAMMAFVIIRKKKQKAQMMSGEMNA